MWTYVPIIKQKFTIDLSMNTYDIFTKQNRSFEANDQFSSLFLTGF